MEEQSELNIPEIKPRAFTPKSLLFGIVGVLIVSTMAGFNDNYLKQTLMIGNFFPIGVFAFFFFLTLLWNLIAGKIWRGLALSSRELAVVLGMALVCCWVPTSGLYRYFQRQIIMPWYYLEQKQAWKETDVLGYMPDDIFPLEGGIKAKASDQKITEAATAEVEAAQLKINEATKALEAAKKIDNTQAKATAQEQLDAALRAKAQAEEHLKQGKQYERVYMGFIQGLAKGNKTLPLSEIPWKAWEKPMLRYWFPLFIIVAVTVIAFSLLLHRQWAHHEQLSYPLAKISGTLLKQSKGRLVADVFSSKLFWWGFGFVISIHMMNYMAAWWPEYFPRISLSTWMGGDWTHVFPILNGDQAKMSGIQSFAVFFCIIGIVYFIPSDVGLSMGLSAILLTFAGVQFYLFTGEPIYPGQNLNVFRGGAAVGLGLILLYTGRSYYFPILLKAFGIGRPLKHEVESVWAARIFIVGSASLVIFFSYFMGLDWLISIVFVLFLMLLFLAFARVVCEAGLPFVQVGWNPGLMLSELFGPAALGAAPLVFVYYLSSILVQDPRETLMPYVSTSFGVAEEAGVKKSKLFPVLLGAIAIALVASFVVILYTYYNYGAINSDGYASVHPPQAPFNRCSQMISFLQDTDQLASTSKATGLSKISLIVIDGKIWGFFLTGAILVILVSAIRFRFAKWPIHPVIFIAVGSYASNQMWSSFLIGWFVKECVVRFGGGKAYQNLKPLFVGIIMGEIIAGGVVIAIALIYYLCTGNIPVSYKILPG